MNYHFNEKNLYFFTKKVLTGGIPFVIKEAHPMSVTFSRKRMT